MRPGSPSRSGCQYRPRLSPQQAGWRLPGSVLLVEQCLRGFEQLALFETHVVVQQRGEAVHDRTIGAAQAVVEGAQAGMFVQGALDQRLLPDGGQFNQQARFLIAKMPFQGAEKLLAPLRRLV